ncbi:MAG: hypothetical protein N5P05_001902 [Chroococcopsis gigantea SAG 12.99]|jgi:predicted Abi (CAAX) family protease|nr:CAAX protease [Chlorogloea purpurea SAG 13.99]MDV3000296.1 hypothetical protein [Chroococcopsis gigantea SAG 12.99]
MKSLWNLISGVFSFQQEPFIQITRVSGGLEVALSIVFLAGLSLAVGQSIILFINKVKPVRFIFSLLISAFLYAFGYFFLVFSTWLIGFLPGMRYVPFEHLLKVFGIGYAPLLFSFFGAIPYLGVPILSLLSVWHLLEMVVGIKALVAVTSLSAFTRVALGWIVLQILQQTIGQPIAGVGRWLSSRVAGVNLVTRKDEIVEIVTAGLRKTPQPVTSPSQKFVPAESKVNIKPALTIPWKSALILLAMVILVLVIAIFLQPLQSFLFRWTQIFPEYLRWIFDLIWVVVIGVAFAGLLAPLETLGWWAGWYNDEIDTGIDTASLAEPIQNPKNVSRYVIYLDGIGQSGSKYLPDVEDFLDALAPSLPENIALIRGLMTYSVLNNSLDQDRPLAFLWRFADRFRFANPSSVLGMLVNIRNVLIVCVSADQRYGPIYNQGIAQIMYNALVDNGYRRFSGIPITLIGYSGGGQMAAASAHFLKRALDCPIDVISLAGVISGNCHVLELEHLYHLVGQKDGVERLGPVMFPERWKIFYFSFWNRAKRLGKISFVSLGPVGHQVPGGLMDPGAFLEDGRSYLQQTVEKIDQILEGEFHDDRSPIPKQLSNYDRYKQAPFNNPDYYPLARGVDPILYRPIADWMGRLILPGRHERRQVRGTWFEVHHAPGEYAHLVGQKVKLRWESSPGGHKFLQAVTRDVHFSAYAEFTSEYGGLIHPDRLNHWRQVNPLESLAGAHPVDDMIVMLDHPVIIEETQSGCILRIASTPVEITGRYYALVRFVKPSGDDEYEVVHFNRVSRDFDGVGERLRLPPPVADGNNCYPSSTKNLHLSPLNETGWYIYGAKDDSGKFVVQSLAPRNLFRLLPDRQISGEKSGYRHIRSSWKDIVAQKGRTGSVMLSNQISDLGKAIAQWQEGERMLLLHVYGGIGGNKREPAAGGPIFFGHFAYGIAKVVREPLTDELRFDVRYYQVYTHNTDGLTAGVLHWCRYMGDRQLGWAGLRPVCDLVIDFDPLTRYYDFGGHQQSPLDLIITHLEIMTARYRIGDGTGGTYVGPANNCAQDSNQAVFSSLREMERALKKNKDWLKEWRENNPEEAQYFRRLLKLKNSLLLELQPFGDLRSDWDRDDLYNLGSTLEDAPIRNLFLGLSSWRTMLPRLASDTIVKIFLDQGAGVWELRVTQIGGDDPDIEPIAPMTL